METDLECRDEDGWRRGWSYGCLAGVDSMANNVDDFDDNFPGGENGSDMT